MYWKKQKIHLAHFIAIFALLWSETKPIIPVFESFWRMVWKIMLGAFPDHSSSRKLSCPNEAEPFFLTFTFSGSTQETRKQEEEKNYFFLYIILFLYFIMCIYGTYSVKYNFSTYLANFFK